MTKLRILLVEDSATDVLLTRKALAAHSIEHELTVIRDGGDAICLIESIEMPSGMACPDIVLIDVNLPKATGFEVLAALKNHAKSRDVPVLITTSSTQFIDRMQAAELGVAGYFVKPLNINEYLELGQMVLWLTQDIVKPGLRN